MTFYVITAVHLDAQGEVERVKWTNVNGLTRAPEGEPQEVLVDRVVEALDRGDIVEVRVPAASGYVSGGKVQRKVLPGGHERIQLERQNHSIDEVEKF